MLLETLQKNKITRPMRQCLSERLPPSLSILAPKIQTCFSSSVLSDEMMQSVATVLQQFGSQGVRVMIKEILQHEALLAHIASVSYLHKNGFYKIILLDDKDFRLRLHVWLPGVVTYETLHNHRWHMASTIIAGKLESEIWEDSSSPACAFYDDYLYVGKQSKPLLLGQSRVELKNRIIRVAGEAYTSQPHVLHRIISVGNHMAATLMCRSSTARKWSRNVIINDLVPDATPNYMTPLELADVLKTYLTLEDIKND